MTDRTHPDSGELDAPGIVPELRAEIERLRAELDAIKSKSILVQLVEEKISRMTTAEFAQFMEAKAALYAHPVPSVPDDEALLRQALEALDPCDGLRWGGMGKVRAAAIKALRERLK